MVRELSMGQELFSDKPFFEYDFLIIEGKVLELVIPPDDSDCFSTIMYRKGDFLGRLGWNPKFVSHTSARCMSKVVALKIPETMLRPMLDQDPQLMYLFTVSMVSMFHRLSEKYCTLVNLSPSQRVAKFLAVNSSRDVNGVIIISTSDLAQAVSTTRQTVSHVLSDLKSRGLIESGYRRIKVLDADGIRKRAGLK